MSDIKQKLLEELLSTPLDEYLDRAVPVGSILIPEEVGNNIGAAQIACGVYARNMCIYLKAWEGIPLLLVALYTGNHVQSAQGQLLASLETYKDPKEHNFVILNPPPAPLLGESFRMAIEITDGGDDVSSVSALYIGPGGSQSFQVPYEQNNIYARMSAGTLGQGESSIEFMVNFGGWLLKKSVTFFVV